MLDRGQDKYILAKGGSGLGDRTLAAATAILYGQISGRKVIIDWTEGTYAPRGVNAFHVFFDSPSVSDLDDLPATDSIYPPTWKGQLDQTFGGRKEQLKIRGTDAISTDLSRVDYEEEILVFCSYGPKISQMRNLFTGDFKKYSQLNNSEILKYLLSNFFVLKPNIKKDFDGFIKSYFPASTKMIGIHIRYSDRKIPVETIYKTLDRVRRRNPDSALFLATDSQAILEDFKAKYDRVITTEKWYPPSGETLHQNWNQCPDMLQNGLEALRDLYLLSQCQMLIFSSRSSFGYVASLLSSRSKLYDIAQPSFLQKLIIKLKTIGIFWTSGKKYLPRYLPGASLAPLPQKKG
ncbi:nodulation protein NodZ [Pannus brasiliensis CCIBt3594]|uniref:Nodulation protein NodZ n=1 Tax=Pannus brasiliensis CCIBt3594 TaxID=1427578 RepID=A0AAW9QVB9_9CHRO